MACKGCERRRQAMKQMMEAGMAHASRLLAIRKGRADGKAAVAPTTDIEGTAKAGTRTRAKPAGKANPAHRQRRVAKAAGRGTDA